MDSFLQNILENYSLEEKYKITQKDFNGLKNIESMFPRNEWM